MHLSHRSGHKALATTERGARDRGYLLVEFALLLVPILLMVSLSVDVGYWYNRISNIQKAADAAALAGVVWLPDTVSAETYARATAERNGFKQGVNGVTVKVEPIEGGQNRRLRVTITDPRVSSFFFQSFGGDDIDLTRRATAEYVLPVPLGSPQNRFGTDPAPDYYFPAPAERANLWGNIHGRKTESKKGDAYSPMCRTTTSTEADNCSGQSNPTYRDTGYVYTIDVPEGAQGLYVQVYDAGLYDRGSDESVETGDRVYTGVGSTDVTWTLYDKDSTELDVTDNRTARQTGLCNYGGDGTWELDQGENPDAFKNKWQTLCLRLGATPAGRYVLRVQTDGNGSSANRYAIRTISSVNSSVQPRLSAYGDMSMYNNVAAGNASFYLAEVAPIHRGKTLELKLYDPGEVAKFTNNTGGNGTIQIIGPNGQVTSTCRASATSGSISSTLSPCQFKSAEGGTAKFNGAWVTLQIPIPTTYSCTVGTIPGCWWKVKYIIDGRGNDTTTWSANIIGDPVHLVEEDPAD